METEGTFQPFAKYKNNSTQIATRHQSVYMVLSSTAQNKSLGIGLIFLKYFEKNLQFKMLKHLKSLNTYSLMKNSA